jgi:hypothetical protein
MTSAGRQRQLAGQEARRSRLREGSCAVGARNTSEAAGRRRQLEGSSRGGRARGLSTTASGLDNLGIETSEGVDSSCGRSRSRGL